MTPTIKQKITRRIDEYMIKKDFNNLVKEKRINWFEKLLLFRTLMSGTTKNVSKNTDDFLAKLGTIIFMDVDGINVCAVKSNIRTKGYSIGIDTKTQHNLIVFRGWAAKKIFERGQSALQR